LPTHEELSQRLKLGRLNLREGLGILRHQGFIETRNKGGTLVRRPTYKTLSEPISWYLEETGYLFEDLVMARAYVESGAAAEAARKRSARGLLTILDALEQLEALDERAESDLVEDEAFHLAIIQATGNPVITMLGELVRLQFQEKEGLPERAGIRLRDNREHRRIYEAIERRDCEAARDAMYAHILGQLNVHGKDISGKGKGGKW
jgi:GntR family transcriptional repressor for pyruvate dehydrogenase complex